MMPEKVKTITETTESQFDWFITAGPPSTVQTCRTGNASFEEIEPYLSDRPLHRPRPYRPDQKRR